MKIPFFFISKACEHSFHGCFFTCGGVEQEVPDLQAGVVHRDYFLSIAYFIPSPDDRS